MVAHGIVLAAGSGRRMGSEEPKQFMSLCGRPVVIYSLEAFEASEAVTQVVLVVPKGDEALCRKELLEPNDLKKVVTVVAGGDERQNSVRAGLEALTGDPDVVAIHDGARPLVLPEQIDLVVRRADQTGAAVLGTRITDTVKVVQDEVVKKTLDRSSLWSVQTPQAFRVPLILEGHRQADATGQLGTDDTSLVERLGASVSVVEGRSDNIKITAPEDLEHAERILESRLGRQSHQRVGNGYDVHRLVEGRPLILGGIEVPHERGLDGHSDADVLTHAVADAILGAICQGDIGRQFPDTDPAYKGISSLVLLRQVSLLVSDAGAEVVNVDATVMAQRPKLASYIPEMERKLAEALSIQESRVSVKATTTEGLGFVGKEEGMAAQAIVLITTMSGFGTDAVSR
jgi:2-C-methyl-D-erythritol 4-phosphate cytidylyltransferase/2-C-methyl-D-erythritol 2,4-cyclodiphosphate synthase